MINSPRDLMGIVHGRVSKLMLDMEAESELEEELKVSNIAVWEGGERKWHYGGNYSLNRPHSLKLRKSYLKLKWLWVITITLKRS